VRSSDLNHKQTVTPSDLFTDTPDIIQTTHTYKISEFTISYQSDFGQNFKDLLRCEVLKVVIMMLLVILVQPL